MSSKTYLIFFVVIILISTLVISSFMNDAGLFQDSTEKISEFWLLDKNHGTSNYPFNVTSGETNTVYVALANHMGTSENYLVRVKLRSYAQYLLEYDSSSPSSSRSLSEFYSQAVDDEASWETPVNFGFRDISLNEDILTVGDVVIDGAVNPIDASTVWNSAIGGYNFQLFFELWRYDTELGSYRFTDLSVGIWLNMTTL